MYKNNELVNKSNWFIKLANFYLGREEGYIRCRTKLLWCSFCLSAPKNCTHGLPTPQFD